MVRLFNANTGDIYYFETKRLAAIFLGELYEIDIDFVSGALNKNCRRYKEFSIRYQ